jgi:hypothetical protein
MACRSERRIGIDSRKLVRRHSHLPLSPSYVFLAEGNPDEEKIGAFGVGRSKHYLDFTNFLMHGVDRLLQLVFGY